MWFAHEKYHRRDISEVSIEFNQLIIELSVHDLTPIGHKYAWINMRVLPRMAKFDRFLVSRVWENKYPQANCIGKPRSTSDHTPDSPKYWHSKENQHILSIWKVLTNENRNKPNYRKYMVRRKIASVSLLQCRRKNAKKEKNHIKESYTSNGYENRRMH